MITLFKKEINQFFTSLTGNLIIIFFLLVNGLFIWGIEGDFNVLDSGYANMNSLFTLAPIIFLIFIPAICMHMFSEEYQSGTIEFLFTNPISSWNIVFSKYLAGNVLVLLAIVPTFIYFFSIYLLGETIGNIDLGGTLGSYIGLFLLSSAFIAIGIFSSAISSNQLISFVIAIFCNTIFYYGFDLLSSIPFLQNINLFISNLGISNHYNMMSKGVIDTRDLIYFLSLCFIFLILSKTIIELKR